MKLLNQIENMRNTVAVKWDTGLKFEADVNGHKIIMDAALENGGNNSGPTPKPLMLASLAGCTGMDVVSILNKMKVEIKSFQMHVEGETTDEHPKYYKHMHVIYEFTGKNLPMDKIKKAVDLSEERYCGVGALYRKAIPVTSEIKLIES